MDEQYVIKFVGFRRNVPIIERVNGEKVIGNEYDRILEMLQDKRTCYIYLAYGYRHKYDGLKHKIGFSIKPYQRLTGLGLGWLHWIPCNYGSRRHCEEILQGYFMEQGKWLGGEWFDLTDEDVEFVKSLNNERDIERECRTQLPWGIFGDSWFRWLISDFKKKYRFPALNSEED